MKKAIKKTCVVLLLFALLVSQVAASYSETGTLNEGTSAISAAERYLSNWAYNSYMYADKNLTLGTVLDAEVDPAKLTLATSEFMALRNDADGQENNISVAVSKMQANIQFMIDKATYFSTIRQYNGLQRTDFNTDYVVQMVSIRPTYFYDVTTCTGANTSHTFSSTNSKCARCGYVRTYIIPTLLTPMAKNTQITLTARTNHTVSSISMSVKNPNGATTNLGTVTNTNSISKVYTPTVAAHPNDLYTVTVTAVSADGVTTSSTWTFRTY